MFWLSLFPFTTAWIDDTFFARTPMVVYGLNLLMAAIAYYVLQLAVFRAEGAGSLLRQALGRDAKGKASPVLYICGIVLAGLVSPWAGLAVYTAVALLWLVPDRRLERFVEEHRVEQG